MLIDLVEYCHVWWIPSFKGVQKVCPLNLYVSHDSRLHEAKAP